MKYYHAVLLVKISNGNCDKFMILSKESKQTYTGEKAIWVPLQQFLDLIHL